MSNFMIIKAFIIKATLSFVQALCAALYGQADGG